MKKITIPLLATLMVALFFVVGLPQEKIKSARPQEVLVKFKPEAAKETVDSLLTEMGLQKVKDFPKIGVGLYKIPSKATVEEVIIKLKDNPHIEYVEPNYQYHINKPREESRESKYKSGEILIKYKREASAERIDAHSAQLGLVAVKRFPEIGIEVCKIPAELSVEEAIRRCEQSPIVEYAEPNYIYHIDEIPNDPRFSDLWGMHNTGQAGGKRDADIDAPEAWDVQKGSRSVLLAVIDTGVDYDHQDLKANMWINPGESGDGRENNGIDDDGNGYVDDFRGWDFVNKDNDPDDDHGHGTHVAGTIGAVGNNGIGVVGVNWRVKIMPLKFLNAQGTGYLSDAISAILYAVDMGAKVLNNSWGGGQYSRALRDAIAYADASGVLFVAAAGNDRRDNDLRPHYPSSYDLPNIIAVAATDNWDNLASFSNYGKKSVDLGAPGVNILSTYSNNRYTRLSGTSMATPHVTGVAGLVLAQFPGISKDRLKARILGSVDYLFRLKDRLLTGGRLNACNALSTSPIIAYTTELPNTRDTVGPYVVTSTIIDDLGVLSAHLLFTTTGAPASADTVEMVYIGEDKYEGKIPGQPFGTTVSYFVLARDTENNLTRSRTFSFSVVSGGGGGCCGTLAITAETGSPLSRSLIGLINLSLVFLPLVLFRRRSTRARHQ